MKPPAASPGRADKPQLGAPGLARLLLSKSRRGGRSRRAPATSPMFVSRGGRSRAGADGEPSSPKVTCIGQVRMRKGKKKKAAAAPKAATPDKAKGYYRCLKKAFLCGGLFEFDRRRRPNKAPPPPPPSEVVERTRRSPWVFSSRDVAVAAAPKPVDARRSGKAGEDEEDDEMEVGVVGVFGSGGREEAKKEPGVINGEKEHEEAEPQLVSSATTTPPKNALLLMRCRSAPQNSTSPLISRFPVAAPSPTRDAPALAEIAACLSPPPPRKQDNSSPAPSPAPRREADRFSPPAPSPSPRRKSEKASADENDEQNQGGFAVQEQAEEEEGEEAEDDEMRCSSARPLVLQRCKSEPATTAAAKMAAGPAASDATTAGCFWATGGSSGRRRHAPAAAVALTGH